MDETLADSVKSGDVRELDWDVDSAELAYGVIARYVDHTQISGMVIALLASALGEERLKPLTQSEYWQAYLAGRRSLVEAKGEIDQLTQMIERMRNRRS
ncbi:MAG: hypothetical protein EBU88_01965 [Acidobacteria bacterium]|nr:hypothetical protein [Acidobacteriota bacterium]